MVYSIELEGSPSQEFDVEVQAGIQTYPEGLMSVVFVNCELNERSIVEKNLH